MKRWHIDDLRCGNTVDGRHINARPMRPQGSWPILFLRFQTESGAFAAARAQDSSGSDGFSYTEGKPAMAWNSAVARRVFTALAAATLLAWGTKAHAQSVWDGGGGDN